MEVDDNGDLVIDEVDVLGLEVARKMRAWELDIREQTLLTMKDQFERQAKKAIDSVTLSLPDDGVTALRARAKTWQDAADFVDKDIQSVRWVRKREIAEDDFATGSVGF